MTLFRNRYRAESARLKFHDYASSGAYFVTICTRKREHYLGQIKNGAMHPSVIGRMAEKFWREIPEHFRHVELDQFVVMPNHVHGIIHIIDAKATETQPAGMYIAETQPAEMDIAETQPAEMDIAETRHAGMDIVETQHAEMDIVETQHAASLRGHAKNLPLAGSLSVIIRSYKSAVTKWANANKKTFAWQSRFHDHIIRDHDALSRIRTYILRNPMNWYTDDLYTEMPQ